MTTDNISRRRRLLFQVKVSRSLKESGAVCREPTDRLSIELRISRKQIVNNNET